MDSIEWRIIEDFPNYEVSNTGLVRRASSQNLITPRMLCNGYMQLGLRRGSKPFYKMVHRLVAAAFIGQISEGMEVNHKDGNKLNNYVDNLEYVTHQKNMQHARNVLGNPGKKLTWQSVGEIRFRLSIGESQSMIAKEFGISIGAVRFIYQNRIWQDSDYKWSDKRKKLTSGQVASIRTRLSSGERRARLAHEFSVSTSTIDNIANSKAWNRLKG